MSSSSLLITIGLLSTIVSGNFIKLEEAARPTNWVSYRVNFSAIDQGTCRYRGADPMTVEGSESGRDGSVLAVNWNSPPVTSTATPSSVKVILVERVAPCSAWRL